MFAFLKERGVIDVSPIASIKAVRPGEDQVQRPYSDEQVRKLLVAVESTIPNNINVEERKVRDPTCRLIQELRAGPRSA
jgi:hypothetical protein